MAPTPLRNRMLLPATGGLVALAIAVGFGAVNSGAYRGEPLPLDSAWMDTVGPGQPAWVPPSVVLHEVGAGLPAFVLASIIAGTLLLWGRAWGAGYFLTAAIASTALVELLKNTIGRPRPADAIIEVGFGSYPSGHSARAAMLAVTLGILIPRLWVWMLGFAYMLAMMFSRTQLGAHWLSDTIGGALTGAAVALLCFAVLSRQLQREGERAHPPPWRAR
ncbi:phosphatase PAP2 family protein [Homoserinimonas sp. A447]